MPSPVLIALISAAASILVAVPATYLAIRKFPLEQQQTRAEITTMITEAAASVIADQCRQIERLEQRVATYEEAIKALQERDREMQRRITHLERQLSKAEARIKELEGQNRALKQENEELRGFYERKKNDDCD